MKTHILTIVLLMCTAGLYAQNVGIGTDTPDQSAKLDVTSTNSGVLVPRILLTDVTLAAPVTAPATGLLVWNTNAAIVGGSGAGFYYWNGIQWQEISAGDHNTLDEAYDEGGAGAGRFITASNGSVAVSGTDGLVVTGTISSGLPIGAVGGIPQGAGVRMFFNPRKAAFRAGRVTAGQWNDPIVGVYSTAFGYNTLANNTCASAFGNITQATGWASLATGTGTLARSYSETAVGSYNTTYIPLSTNLWNAADRVFVVGNGSSAAARSNALTIYKNGTMNINDAYNMPTADGTAGQVLTTDGAGVVSFQTPTVFPSGTAGQVLTIDGAGVVSFQTPTVFPGWEITGNAGTDATTNFIGTTDAQEFSIRTNNVLHHRITLKGQLEFLQTGYSVSIGEQAGENDDQTNNYNSFIGNLSGRSNTSGYFNTAVGASSLFNNSLGYENTALGYRSLINSGGSGSFYNTAVGASALPNLNSGDYNSAIGRLSGTNFYNGSENTFVGGWSGFSVAWSFSNSTAIGYASRITGSNMVRIGNTIVTSIGGYANWTVLSDGRYKNDVIEDIKGLDFILGLRPVSYTIHYDKLNAALNISDTVEKTKEEQEHLKNISQIRHSGFIAQEVEELVDKLGASFNGVDKPKNENDHYGLRYSEFVVPLVKATQEQQAIIESQNKRIEQLEEELQEIRNLIKEK